MPAPPAVQPHLAIWQLTRPSGQARLTATDRQGGTLTLQAPDLVMLRAGLNRAVALIERTHRADRGQQ